MGTAEIRQELIEYYEYLSLTCALMSYEATNSSPLPEYLRIISEFIRRATSKDLKGQGKELVKVLRSIDEKSEKFLPRKQPIRQIANDFLNLRKDIDLLRFGIPLGWLQKRFDTRSLRIAPDLPPHAKI